MALVSRSSKCFKAVETALEAVKSGNIYSSGIILKSIKQDGLLLQQDVSALSIQLRQAEAEHQLQVESLTRQINELYQVQIKCKERQGELEERKFSLINAKNCYSHSKQVALRNYQEAREEQREAERKYDEFRFLFWVPIVGWILTVRELIQENGNRASDAYGEMLRYENDIERADSDIEWANDSIFEVSNKTATKTHFYF